MTAEPEPTAAVSADPRLPAMRTQAMVLAFYLLDTVLLALYAALGELPPSAPIAYGAAACALVGLFGAMVRAGVSRRIGGARFTALQLSSACGLMLVTAALWPQAGVLMLMTLITAIATAALRLPSLYVLVISSVIAAVALALLQTEGSAFEMPSRDWRSRLLSGLWFAVSLTKIAAINKAGTEMRKVLAATNAKLADALARVRELSERDELTGLQNRRSILALLAEERARFARGGPAFGMAILDIDHFKQINDRFGHATGDSALRTFAKVVGATLRSTDRLARYGGEEFLLLLPNARELDAVRLAAERVRRTVEQHPWEEVAAGLKLTCSIGTALSHSGEDIGGLIERADAALYLAKSGGRNVVRAG